MSIDLLSQHRSVQPRSILIVNMSTLSSQSVTTIFTIREKTYLVILIMSSVLVAMVTGPLIWLERRAGSLPTLESATREGGGGGGEGGNLKVRASNEQTYLLLHAHK